MRALNSDLNSRAPQHPSEACGINVLFVRVMSSDSTLKSFGLAPLIALGGLCWTFDSSRLGQDRENGRPACSTAPRLRWCHDGGREGGREGESL